MHKLATFSLDVTPPTGHPLCAGWLPPSLGTTDPLFAKGLILTGKEDPIVLCAIDWCEISNRSHLAWRFQIAEAVGTTMDRVTVHCMHPHCTPWPDEHAQKLVQSQQGIEPVMDEFWCAEVLARFASAAGKALNHLQPLTHVTIGRARVEGVASNRRILDSDGKIKAIRWTRTVDPEVRAEPEGLIDPWLKTVGFWNGDEKLAASHYYAVHPSSFEDSFVTSDFTGLAREQRQAQDSDVPHFFFTECAGDITAGKYNDGAVENREILTERIRLAMAQSENDVTRVAADEFEWRSVNITLPPRGDITYSELRTVLENQDLPSHLRCRAALMLAYHERAEVPISIGALHLGEALSILHLPGEAFMEYQIFAQQQRPESFVVAPAYGDCGPGYICLEGSFEEGGYEPYDSFVAPQSEAILKEAIANVMRLS